MGGGGRFSKDRHCILISCSGRCSVTSTQFGPACLTPVSDISIDSEDLMVMMMMVVKLEIVARIYI